MVFLVYATTAANSEESSYACYLDEERGTYLGDVYSVNWMEDSDAEDLKSETLEKQFSIVKQETNTSHVMEFGDKVRKHSREALDTPNLVCRTREVVLVELSC